MKPKKLILLLFALVVGIGNGWAAKTYVDLSKVTHPSTYTNNARWDNNTIYWKNSGNNVVEFPGFSGDMSEYNSVVITTSELTANAEYRLLFKINGTNYIAVLKANGTTTIPLYGDQTTFYKQWSNEKLTKDLLKNVEYFAIAGQSAATEENESSVKVESIYFTRPLSINYGDDGICTLLPADIVDNVTTTGDVTFNETTGEIVVGAEGGTLTINFDGIDFREVTQITNNFSTHDYLSETIIYRGDTGIGSWSYSKVDLSVSTERRVEGITRIVYTLTNGSFTLNSVQLKSNVMECVTAGMTSLNTLPYKKISDGTAVTPAWNDGTTDATVYGTLSGDVSQFADITDYEELRIYKEANDLAYRLFLIPETGSGTCTQIYSDKTTYASWNAEGKYISFNITALPKYDGKVALQAIKTAGNNLSSNPVTQVVLYKTPAPGTAQYSISGAGVKTSAVKTALADANVTLLDATGLTNAYVIELVSANPNCIIKAEADKLSNANNVMVGTTIASLSLTDKKPFAVPAGATAEAATYDRTFTAQYSTVCLPFNATFTGTAYEFTSQNGTEVTFTKVDALTAGKAYLVGDDFAVTGGSGALADVDKSSAFQGTYTQQILNSGYGFGDGEFVKCNGATLNPFRAYLNIAENAGVKKMNVRFGGEETAVADMAEVINSAKAIYGVNGVRQRGLQKGINIIKMANGETRKVIIK